MVSKSDGHSITVSNDEVKTKLTVVFGLNNQGPKARKFGVPPSDGFGNPANFTT
jgi:hypothetical protein